MGTVHQLLANTLNMLNTSTRKAADHLALKPTATIMHAARPTIDTNTRTILHSPWRIKPRKRKIKSTRPARRKLEWQVRQFVGRKDPVCLLFLAVSLAKRG